MEKIIFLIILFIFPLFGKIIDFNESIFFYSLPSVLIFYIIIAKKESLKLRSKPFIFISLIISLFAISYLFSKNFGSSYYFLFIFINCLLMALVAIKKILPADFEKGLLLSTGVYSIVFLLNKISFINLNTSILSDNVIKQIYGHSYLADLIVLVFPFILFRINSSSSKKQKYLNYFLFIFFLIVLIITNSRSGITAVALGLLFINSKNKTQKITKILSISLFLVFLSISFTPKYQNKFDKTIIGERNKYWSIAFKGFLDSPIIGNGPNTFSIIRRQKQEESNITSVTHNSILTFLCENGIIFTLVFFIAIFYGLKDTKKNNNIFFVTSIIAIVHSFLDPTWNSSGILIISLYLIFYYSNIFKDTKKEKNTSMLIFFLTIICFIFFILDTLSNQLLIARKYEQSLIFNPFNLNSRMEIISKINIKTSLWEKNINFTLKYFGKNEVVYKTLIEITPYPKNEEYYYKLFELNPKENYPYYLKLLKNIKKTNDFTKLETLFKKINESYNENEIPTTYAIPLSKEIYNYALFVYQNDKIKSLEYFKLSVKLIPNSGHYQVDLANALWNSNQKQNAINQLSINCQRYIYAKEQCQTYLDGHQYINFNQPGIEEYTSYINNVLK